MGNVPLRAKRARVVLWFTLIILVVLGVHMLATVTTNLTISQMRSLSPFAQEVRAFEETLLPYWRPAMYLIATAVIIVYLSPIAFYFWRGQETAIPECVQRRVVRAPAVVAVMSFVPWCVGAVAFPLMTYRHFGHWSADLMSQQVLGPVVNGFLAAATSYLLLEWVFRGTIFPRVFPSGRLAEVPGAMAPGVRARFLIFLVAIVFVPLFSMLGLIRAAAMRVDEGLSAAEVVASTRDAGTIVFFLYVALGVVLTLILARSLTRPLGEVASALRRVQRGDLDVHLQVGSADEVGVLEDGVNAMVTALRDRERILQTFGRVVEPSVRDHLLSGAVGLGGEVRTASVLFCDLRDFTAMAERTPPTEVVATLNEFFTVMTAWVRECGGFVDKFIGDAMLVVFGLFGRDGTTPDAAGAAAAVRCAVGMGARLDELNVRRVAAGREPLELTAAIHTGEVLAGTIGAADRHEFTVIGDTVNVAARLQHLCKEEGCTLLVTERTYELAHAGGAGDELSLHDEVRVRGRSTPIRVFALGAIRPARAAV